MKKKPKTFYLWDLAGTLFLEEWDVKNTGLKNMKAYAASLGYNKSKPSPKVYESLHKIPYSQGLFKLKLPKGFKQVLTWTKENYIFTTGVKQQLKWRAKYLNPRVGYDVTIFFKKIHSTFDYGNTNTKTFKMVEDVLKNKIKRGYTTAVYTDNKTENCQEFLKATKKINKRKKILTARVYHFNNNKSKLKKVSNSYFEIGNLLQLLKNENEIFKKFTG